MELRAVVGANGNGVETNVDVWWRVVLPIRRSLDGMGGHIRGAVGVFFSQNFATPEQKTTHHGWITHHGGKTTGKGSNASAPAPPSGRLPCACADL